MLSKSYLRLVKSCCLLFASLICGCTDSLPPYINTPTYGCFWSNSCDAKLDTTVLNLPDANCETPFQNYALEIRFPDDCTSLFEFLTNISNGTFWQLTDFRVTWTTKVFEKKCDDANNQSKQKVWSYIGGATQNDLQLSNGDIIPNSPLTATEGEIRYDELQHELVIEIFNVTNDYDGSQGILTWKKTWIGYQESVYQGQDLPWIFNFPTQGLTATYTVQNGYPRYIYVHNQFDYYN